MTRCRRRYLFVVSVPFRAFARVSPGVGDLEGVVGTVWKMMILLVLLMLNPCDGLFRSVYRSGLVSTPLQGDTGRPLFLTPYIKAGKIKEGKERSMVSPLPGVSIKSYAGYITVNETYNSNLFFWFFPAQIQPMDAPVVLWLQGGPGGSSMFGLFVENGPYVVTKNLTLNIRDFPWTTTLSMLYIDNPVGTGFSFTDDPQGYATNEDDVARNLYREQGCCRYHVRFHVSHGRNTSVQFLGMGALIQFFQLFPEYKDNDFYATGESYAGKYVPAIAHYIHTFNPTQEQKINLKGIALGDAYSDPESIIGGYATFLYQIGLLDENQKKYFQKQCDECIKHIKKQNWLKAFEDPEDQVYYGKFLSLPEVRQAIHVGNHTFNDGSEVEKYLREDTVQSVKPWLTEIMNNYKVLIYNGQLDIIVAGPPPERSLMAMDWKGSQKYRKVERKVWKIFKSDLEVAGYVRQVDDFYQV
ncbi:putative serine carboxypeptidase CPVL [Tupaia chinensis]|uniref:Putative serine carboxypeptidase CPVL n=1 Tax=Tupaia chinensis TaxID=246437 RepID=L9KYY8_TUPCH|nr:putative serine carboxypeptidase CPVL [Tupaia chinensis]